MPELPEVETIKSQISPLLPMRVERIVFSEVSGSIVKQKSFKIDKFTIEKIERKGKVLRFFLDKNRRIISGLGMSGSWRISHSPIYEKHTHVQFCGSNEDGDLYLGYIDPRRFGKMHFVDIDGETEWLKRLGPDVSTEEFTLDYLLDLKKKKPQKVLKPFLLEQDYFSGVGNYMASEICARAKLRPTRRMKTLSKNDLKNILKATKLVLDDTISTGGTTFSGGYQDANGEKGEGVKNLVVFYQEICGMCEKTEVKKVTLATRGTYYCPHCQK